MAATTLHLKPEQLWFVNDQHPPEPDDAHAVDDLRAVLIHDLRSPLAAISGYAQLMARRAARSPLEIDTLLEALWHIELAASRMNGLLDELGRVSALPNTRSADLWRQPMDLVELAQRVAITSEVAGLSNRQVVVLSAVRELIGLWDAEHLERALANLIENALKYTTGDSSVVVTVSRAETWAVVSVADRGVGIPAAELARVCEPGYRATNVDRQFPGTGLGLVSVRDMVTEHGGAMDLESQVGVGTTVTLRLPLGADEAGNESNPPPIHR
jgi:two-component system, OmpR family, phosphate regulon sensor histidine kinase PhoR